MAKRKVHLNIGGYHASSSPTVISTVLGSCVAVCLYDSVLRIGGMNHILMPGKADMKHFNQAARFGINAMELLINALLKLRCDRRRLIGKVFGGGAVIPAISDAYAVGRKNVEFAFDFLEKERIEIMSYDVGGKVSRKLYFHTDTGEVFLKRMTPTLMDEVLNKEDEGRRKIEAILDNPTDITLFDR